MSDEKKPGVYSNVPGPPLTREEWIAAFERMIKTMEELPPPSGMTAEDWGFVFDEKPTGEQ